MENMIPSEKVLIASAFAWNDGKLSGNWGKEELGRVRGLPESDVRSTICVWIRMLRRHGTQDVDRLLKELLEPDSGFR